MHTHGLFLASFCCSFTMYLLTSKLLSSVPEVNVLKIDSLFLHLSLLLPIDVFLSLPL